MSFAEFIDTAWAEHGDQPHAVAERIEGALALPASVLEVRQLAGLITHVHGEHLARWQAGIELLETLRTQCRAASDPLADAALSRSIAVLQHADHGQVDLSVFSAEDRISILAMAASALQGNGQLTRSIQTYREALQRAQAGLPDGSPALRALAVSGNNLAASLEEKSERDAWETAGMVEAAEAALIYWRRAGGWLEEERAEYRLARSLLCAALPDRAVDHARNCVAICIANSAPPVENFFACAAMAMALRAGGDTEEFGRARTEALEWFSRTGENEKSWCKDDLAELND